MKLNYMTFMIRDIEKTIHFYQDLVGLKVINRFNPGMGEIVFLQNEDEETMLEFIQFDDAEKVSVKGMVMSFKADDSLEELRKKFASAGFEPSAIIDQKPKPAHFTVEDPDGVVVEFSG